KLVSATRSRRVLTFADKILTWCSASTAVRSESNCFLSNAKTTMSTVNDDSEVGAHSTSIKRSGSGVFTTFGQSLRCTEIPEPRVTNPMMLSGGTGAQQRANFAITSPAPATIIPESVWSDGCGLVGNSASSLAGSYCS